MNKLMMVRIFYGLLALVILISISSKYHGTQHENQVSSFIMVIVVIITLAFFTKKLPWPLQLIAGFIIMALFMGAIGILTSQG